MSRVSVLTGRKRKGLPAVTTTWFRAHFGNVANRRAFTYKNIPHGGGLGGGSADAAAIFRWANYQDLEAASRIGADIPFCMVGGRARVRGIGEIIEPLPFVARTITLILLPFGVSTPVVYRAFDALPHNPTRS